MENHVHELTVNMAKEEYKNFEANVKLAFAEQIAELKHLFILK